MAAVGGARVVVRGARHELLAEAQTSKPHDVDESLGRLEEIVRESISHQRHTNRKLWS